MSSLRFGLLLGALLFSGGANAGAGRLYKDFRQPPRSFSLMPYWYWNGKITQAETRRQIREMVSQGVYQAVVFPWDGMEVRYLSEDYWRQVGAALDIAKEYNFTLNFADEYDWPSGHAWDARSDQPELSRVLQAHPEFRMRRLDYREQTIEAPAQWTAAEPMEFAVAGRMNAVGALERESLRLVTSGWAPDAGRWLVTAYRLVPAVGGHNTRVDLLNPDAVKVYIDLVYEEYARRFPQHLGKTLRLTLADHEGAYGSPIAWTHRLWQEFEKRWRYDLRSTMPLLVHDSADGSYSHQVRRHYLDTISDLYVNSFPKQVADWCSRHGIGHATSAYEEQLAIQISGAGDMFEFWRSGSHVEIDALLERARQPIDFKEAVSVAHLDRKPLVVENQGLQGHSTSFSLEKARLGTNMCILWGADRLVPYFEYEPAKVNWPPQWFLGQPFWRYFRHYADYVRRATFMNSQGRHVAPVAIYYPLETAQANSQMLFTNKPHRDLFWGNSMDQTQNFYSALQIELAREGWDYHILDRRLLGRAAVAGKALRIADEEFRVLILPPMTDMDERASAKVREFADAGGTVLALGQLPEGLDAGGIRRFSVREHAAFMDRLDYMRPVTTPEPVRDDLSPLLATLRSTEPPQVTVRGAADVYFSHRTDGNLDWYWFVNNSGVDRVADLGFPRKGTLEKWDAETGTSTPLPSDGQRVRVRFSPWDAFFLVQRRGGGAATVPERPPRESVILTLPPDAWRITLDPARVRVPYAIREPGTEQVWLAPERLANAKWWLIGPFPYDDHQGFYRAYPPESGFDAGAKYTGAYGEVAWKWVEREGPAVTLRDALSLPRQQTLGVFYAYGNVYSPSARPAQLRVAFADGMRVWVNGEMKMSVHRHPKWLLMRDAWTEQAAISLRQGWNRVLLKIEPSLSVPTAFLFRIAGPDGATLRDLVYSRDERLESATPRAERITVRVPPSANAVEMPPSAKRFRLLVDGAALETEPGALVPLPPAAKECTFEIDAADEPEQAVSFRSGTAPFAIASWTDTGLAHYSGAAVYETRFDLPDAPRGSRILLDLGAVGVAAEVWLNGSSAGERTWRPFRFDITNLVRATNVLRVRIANSDAGWQSQGGTIYPRGSWGLKYLTELDRLPTIRPNGLEGPVRILESRTEYSLKKTAR